MKKLILSTLSIALLAGGISSCGKSSRGKMSNDWKVDSYESKTTDVENNGDQTITTTKMEGSTVTVTTTDSPSGESSTTTTQSGTLSNSDFTIDKNGTWEMARTYSFTSNPATGITVVTNYVESQSGNWSFIGKNKDEDFKKNERVMFNTLTSTSTTTSTTTIGSSSNTTTSTTNDTYMSGDNVMIFTVTESKGKELELTSDAKHTSATGNNSNSSSTTTTLKMTEK